MNWNKFVSPFWETISFDVQMELSIMCRSMAIVFHTTLSYATVRSHCFPEWYHQSICPYNKNLYEARFSVAFGVPHVFSVQIKNKTILE